MKVKCYTTETTTYMVEVDVPADAPDHVLQYQANVARNISGCKVIEKKEVRWYVKEDEEDIPKFGNPLHM